MSNAVIVGYARSPFTPAHKGELARVRPDDLAAQVVRGLLDRTRVDPEAIEDLILGCAFPEGEQGFNVARLVGMIAGLPRSVAGTTVNRWCGSSMQAVHVAAGAIALGAGHAFIAAGVESMTRVPMMGFNPIAQSGARGKGTGRLHGDGHHRREPGGQVRHLPRRAGGLRRPLPPEGRRGAVRRQARRRDRRHRNARRGAGGGGRLHPRGSHRREAGDPEARLQLRGIGDGRHLVAAHRRRRRGPGGQRGVRQGPRPEGAGPHPRDGGRRLRPDDHGHRPGSRHPEGAEPRQARPSKT